MEKLTYNPKTLHSLSYFINHVGKGKLFFEDIPYLKAILLDFFGENITIYESKIVRNVVKQYNSFVNKIISQEENLYNQENRKTLKEIFYKIAFPMDIIKYAIPNYHNSSLREFSNEIVENYSQLSKSIANQNILEVSEKQLEFVSSFFDTYLKNTLSTNLDKSINIVKDILESQEKGQELPNKINEILESSLTSINKRKRSLQEIYDNPTEFGRNFLRTINYIQSHMEYFCVFFRRLIHIIKENTNNYEGRYYDHFNNKFEDKEFRKICRKTLSFYPDLKNYLIQITRQLRKLRNINAHQIPRKFTIIPEYDLICFPVVGRKGLKCISHKKTLYNMIKYAFFFNNIDFHQKNSYKKEEKMFILFG
ncbi:MAG: hypothetical protein GF311_02055 [Candidatus Lokiarchaeota archaeon]|nr:hypothetical protein [Candidatus Lokiarchaeota archaeon]